MNNSLEKVKEFHETFSHPIGEEDVKTKCLRIALIFEELTELADASNCNKEMLRLCYLHIMKVTATKNVVHNTADLAESFERFCEENSIKNSEESDKVEELDALCDLQYVLSGTVLTKGLHEVFDDAFNKVHENNMGKLHKDKEHAITTARIRGIMPYRLIQTEKGIILTNDAGKVIKPHDFTPVELSLNS